jgi:2-oxo-4-hydroxy-4-carboxy-5-ureidoimidazoline decarboxylase
MNSVLSSWNGGEAQAALDAMLACCGARRWAAAMVALRPIAGVQELSASADQVWSTMEEADWMEAFASHPRIGERRPRRSARALKQSGTWSGQEQSAASSASERVLAELAAGNNEYEQRFGFTYIVCATGRSAEEMLAILNRRLGNERAKELREAAEQQRQITQIRLGKWLVE